MQKYEFLFNKNHILNMIQQTDECIYVIKNNNDEFGLIKKNDYEKISNDINAELIGIAPILSPEYYGSQAFKNIYHLKYPYIVGEMANGVATAKMVISAAQHGMFGFFGSAGLMPDEIRHQLLLIREQLGEQCHNWGSNLIYMPNHSELESRIVDLYIALKIKNVSASAYMTLTPALIQLACTGLHADRDGNIDRPHQIIAKLSRPEIASKFLSPAPKQILDLLVKQNKITKEEASLANYIPVANCITVEGDSGGHTDNRPLSALYSTIHELAISFKNNFQYKQPIFIGAAGGLGTPSSIAAAFTLGADYVLTGSINASAVESGFSDEVKQMLSEAGIADVMMAPAADMFELGVKLQILKRGTLFGMRAQKLFDIYKKYECIESIPRFEKERIEKEIFHDTLENIWRNTRIYFLERDPKQVTRAESDPKFLMALVFRWYLGQSTRWAINGESKRKIDYQIWCGPSIGSFNSWVSGTFLSDITKRSVVQIGKNLLQGATVFTRATYLRNMGMPLSIDAFQYKPRYL